MVLIGGSSDMSGVRHGTADRRTISVVIPLYNQGSVVGRALQSVLSQGYERIEIVVIDDGSADQGATAVREMRDPRVRVLQQSNRGVSAARNLGIAETTGELVAFLDADDEWLPSYLDTILQLRCAYPQACVYGTRYYFRHMSGKTHQAIVRGLPASHWQGILPEYFEIACVSDPPLLPSAAVVTRAGLAAIGGFPVGIGQGEDLVTWARLAFQGEIAYSSRPLVFYEQLHFRGARPSRFPAIPDLAGEELAKLLPACPAERRDTFRRYLGCWYAMRGACFLGVGRPRDARANFQLAREHGYYNTGMAVRHVISHLPAPWAVHANWLAHQVRCCLRDLWTSAGPT